MEEKKKKKDDGSYVRIDPRFKERIETFIKEYEEKKGLKISVLQATHLLEKKISRLGGLIVE